MTEMLLEPVTGTGAWTADMLTRDPSWIHRLGDSEIAELERALERVLSRGIPGTPFAADAFELSELGEVLTDIARNVESGHGVALVKGLPVERYEPAALRALYWGIALYFGEAVSQNSRGELIAEVTDKGNDHDDMNVRGYKTRAELQPHVDSCDMTALLCVNPARSGGESMVTSAMAMHNVIVAEHREHLPTLYQGFHHDLRGEGITGRIDEVTHHAIPVFSYFEGCLSCAFNSRIMRSAREKVGPPLTKAEDAAIELILSLARREDLRYRMRLETGDIQLVNNYTVLHSRDDYEDDPARPRNLLRLWFRFHRERRLAPGFADRYNTGSRGGVAVGDGARYSF